MLGIEKRANKSASLSIKDEKSRGTTLFVYDNFHKATSTNCDFYFALNYQSTLRLGSFDLTE
jgi:hypothetical protein